MAQSALVPDFTVQIPGTTSTTTSQFVADKMTGSYTDQFSFQSGQLNNFDPSGRQIINGSLDVVFGNTVPEPASIALLGLGLVGLGLSRRRNSKKN